MAREQSTQQRSRPASAPARRGRVRAASGLPDDPGPVEAAATEADEERDAGRHLPGEPTVRWAAVPVPVGVRVPVPRLRPGDTARQAVHAAQVVRGYLPPPERLVYYGGLGVMAAVGVVEWPVAAALGAGLWLANRRSQRLAGLDWRTSERVETGQPAE